MHLEYRVCRELERHPGYLPRGAWCDGLVPHRYALDEARQFISGAVFLMDTAPEETGPDFTLFLPARVEGRAQIDWASLLPAEEQTLWMSLDAGDGTLVIDLAAAVPVGSATALQSEFWRRLRKHIASQVSQRSATHVRCDAPAPEQLLLDDEPPRIDGSVSIAFGDRVREHWDFTVSLPKSALSRGTIDWGSLLPALDSALLVEVDSAARRISTKVPIVPIRA